MEGIMIFGLEWLNRMVWGLPALVLILGVGVYFSFRTGFAQIKLFPRALKLFLSRLRPSAGEEGSVSAFQALCTALAATVGTGNIAGVAGAIAIGGPGAIFWMWVCAVFGMITKFAEATLAVRYRIRNGSGDYVGGPMYMIQNAMDQRWHWLAGVYCFFGVIAAFGVGNATQINAVIAGINEVAVYFGGAPGKKTDLFIGVVLAALVSLMLLGGAKRIGTLAEKLVPFASVAYLLLGAGVLIICRQRIPNAFCQILRGAFSPAAVSGGVIAKNQPFGSHRTGKVGIHQAAGKLFSKIVLYAVKDFLIQPEFGQQFHKNIFGKLLRFGRISQLHSQSVVPAADIQINAVIVQKRVEFFFCNTVVPGGNELAQKLGHALGVSVFPNRTGRQNRRKGIQRDIVPLQHRKTAGVFERASYRYSGRIFRIALANQTFCRRCRNRPLSGVIPQLLPTH